MPSLKWALLLHVGKVMIPFKFCDNGDPFLAPRQEGGGSKRCRDDRADSSRMLNLESLIRRRRLDELEMLDPSLRFRRHELRQVLRIREEGEYVRHGKGNPAGKLKSVWHGLKSDADITKRLISTRKRLTGADCKKNRSE
jgi:hypothetical protein